MSKVINLEKRLCLTLSDSVAKISSPILDIFDIKVFRYLKIFDDNSRIVLCNNPDNTRYIYEEGNYRFMWYDGKLGQFLKEGWHSWKMNLILDKTDIHKKIENELINFFNLSQGLAYVKRGYNFYEIFSFGSGNENIYKQEKNLYMRFIYYFREQARKLIRYVESEKIIVPNFDVKNISFDKNEKKINEYIKKTRVNRYYVGGKYDGVYLTQKEINCIYWILSGKTSEEISIIENNKIRTIEKHLQNIKNKFNCYKQTQLIKIILELDLPLYPIQSL